VCAGLDFSVPRLYVLDGGKALAAALPRHAGEAALIQRCQVHKRRNVIDSTELVRGNMGRTHAAALDKSLTTATLMIMTTLGPLA
jgi:hypothetical protein